MSGALFRAVLRRFLATVEPWYDWGRIYVSRLDTTQPNGDGVDDGEVRYFDLQWLGVHLAFHVGRVPPKGNRGGEALPTHQADHSGNAGAL